MKSGQVRFRTLSGAALAALALPVAASAQTAVALDPISAAPLFRPDVAGTRSGPDRAEGIAVGGWILRPSAGFGALADSNVFNLPGDQADGDVAALQDARLDLSREEGARRFAMSLGVLNRVYASLPNQTTTDALARVGGIVPVGATELLSIGAEAARVTEPRGTGGLNFAEAGAVIYDSLRATGRLTHEGARLRTEVALSAARRLYQDVDRRGAPDLKLGFRDVRVYAADARAAYYLTPAVALLALTRLDRTESLAPLPGLERDADGERVMAGARVAFGDLVVGEAAAGWTARQFTSPAFRDYGGPTAHVRLDWYPTPLVSYRLSADQDFENSGLARVSAVLSRSAALVQYWEALRTLTVVTRIGYSNDRFRELRIGTDSVAVSTGGAWRFRRDLSFTFDVSARRRWSSAPATVNAFHGIAANVGLKAAL